jgi:hypothetical protein
MMRLFPALTGTAHAQWIAAANPPAVQPGGQNGSMTLFSGLRVQLQDGLGHDIGASYPLPISLPTGAATATNQASQLTAEQQIATNTALRSGTPNQVSVTCGASSTALLAASTATVFLKVHVPATAANIVWINWAGVAAVAAAPSESISPGGSVNWTNGPAGYLPTSAVYCIAAASVTVTVEYK